MEIVNILENVNMSYNSLFDSYSRKTSVVITY